MKNIIVDYDKLVVVSLWIAVITIIVELFHQSLSFFAVSMGMIATLLFSHRMLKKYISIESILSQRGISSLVKKLDGLNG